MKLTTDFSEGFFLGISLIMSIGAQNAFVIKQGLLRSYIFIVCLICIVCDTLLITLGCFGAGQFFAKNRMLALCLGVVGVLFLAFYAFKNILSAISSKHSLQTTDASNLNIKQVIKLTLCFTLLNPHVYLDTIVLFGSFSAQLGELSQRINFTLGGITASLLWFFLLGYGAFLLSPIFIRKWAWKLLEFFVGIFMIFLCYKLSVLIYYIYADSSGMLKT